MDGILLINKPKGITSFDVIRKLKKILNTTKIGHSGTLDPFAEGLLLVLVGRATKLSNMLMSQNKTYEGTLSFGKHYDTYDYTGEILKEDNKVISLSDLEGIKGAFLGTYMQTPPIYSAIKKDGKKLYEYARSGIDVKLEQRMVTINSLEFNSLSENSFKFITNVSSGTYIRSLAVDLATSLNTYGYLASLKRVSSGSFNLRDSYLIEEVNENSLITISDYFKDSPKVVLSDYLIKLVRNGIRLDDRQIVTNEIFKVYDEFNNLVAIYEPVGINEYKPLIVL